MARDFDTPFMKGIEAELNAAPAILNMTGQKLTDRMTMVGISGMREDELGWYASFGENPTLFHLPPPLVDWLVGEDA